MTAMTAAEVVHGWGGAAAAALLSDAEALRCDELRRSRFGNDLAARAEADAVTQRLVDSMLAPVVAFLLANDDRPEVVARVREVVPLRRPHVAGRPGRSTGRDRALRRRAEAPRAIVGDSLASCRRVDPVAPQHACQQ